MSAQVSVWHDELDGYESWLARYHKVVAVVSSNQVHRERLNDNARMIADPAAATASLRRQTTLCGTCRSQPFTHRYLKDQHC